MGVIYDALLRSSFESILAHHDMQVIISKIKHSREFLTFDLLC